MYKLNMAEIRIIYQIDNAAFDETPLPETKRILDEIKEAMSNGSQGGLIQDKNGNGIGAWVIEGGEERYSEEEEPWTGDAYNPSEDEEFGFGRNDGPRDDN
jgi:hypothetical protein